MQVILNELTATSSTLGLYVHFPWCLQKCPYCDFNSHTLKETLPQDKYIDALIRDLQWDIPKIQGRTIKSIFLGGGTPSIFSADSINRLISTIREMTIIASDVEITMEANPGAIDQSMYSAYLDAGINRLSIGVQSFNFEFLKAIGRIHDGIDAFNAIDKARSSGYRNINIDLMFGLPGQSILQAMDDLQIAASLNPEHLSYYQLTVEKNTAFYANPPNLPADTVLSDMHLAGIELLKKEGYFRYEISAFAKPGKHSRHNCNYWNFGDYVGIGAGAHSKLTDFSQARIYREWKVKHPAEYMESVVQDRAPIKGRHQLNVKELQLEFFMNAFRLCHGFRSDEFTKRTGLSLMGVQKKLDMAQSKGLIQIERDIIKPTSLGSNFLNDLLLIFA